MFNKRRARELAMQSLFIWDSTGEQDLELARNLLADSKEEPALQSAAMQMATGAWEQREMIDKRVEKIAPQWPPRRQPAVDRNLIRLAVWELTNLPTPPKVVIDEAIELAKHFSTEQSPSFINGVLDAVLRENRALTEGLVSPEPTTPQEN
jgi:transcription antitermination protein NusB